MEEIVVAYNPDLVEAKALLAAIKEKLEGYKSATDIICRVNALITQLQ